MNFRRVAPKIPINRHFSGDIDSCDMYLDMAEAELYNLERDMEFQNIKHLSPEHVNIGGGVMIGCSINYGIYDVYIHVPLPVVSPDVCVDKKIQHLLVAGGYMDSSPGIQTVGEVNLNYDAEKTEFSDATEITQVLRYRNSSFFQVRYLTDEYVFDTSDGQKKANLIYTLGISTGLVFTGIAAQYQIKHNITISIVDTSLFDKILKDSKEFPCGNGKNITDSVSSFTVEKIQTGLVSGCTASANLSTDRTKLYVAYGDVDDSSGGPRTGSVIYSVYILNTENGFSWDLESSFTVSSDISEEYPLLIDFPYVDQNGDIYGMYKEYLDGDGLLQNDYYLIDINTGNMSSAIKSSVGMTVAGGNFSGIYKNLLRNPAISEPISGTYNDNGVCPELTYVDDGQGSLVTGDPECIEDIGLCFYDCDYDDDCTRIRFVDVSAAYWYTWSSYYSLENMKEEFITWGGGGRIDTITGYVDSTIHSGSSSTGYTANVRCYNGCTAPSQYECFGSYTTTSIENTREIRDGSENVSVISGTITLYDNTSRVTYSRIIDNQASYPGVCTLIDTACPLYKSVAPTEGVANDSRNIKHPFKISNATGVKSFIAWDNNEDGLVIKGLRYILDGNYVDDLRVEIDGVDVKNTLLSFISMDEINFHFIGFRF